MVVELFSRLPGSGCRENNNGGGNGFAVPVVVC